MKAPVTIPFGDLSAEVREIRAEVDEAIDRVLTRGWFVLGEEGEAFEAEFARFVGVRTVVGCANGTDAITIALRTLELEPGAEVITVANTCVPTAAGIRDAGCTLALVDCDPSSLQMQPAALEAAITARTRAVVAVHLYGASPDMEAIARICRDAGVHLVEDCAQAHGAAFRGRAAGQWGVISAWSFYPSKNLGAYGDGGAVATDDPALGERARSLRNYGERVRYHHDLEGRNSRLDEIQAAILRVKLGHLAEWNDRRRRLAARYARALAETAVRVPTLEAGCVSAHHLYPVRVPAARRDGLRDELARRGVGTQIHYPIPLHRQGAYAAMFGDARFPAAEAAANELVSLPLFPQLADSDADRVADALLDILTR